MTAYKPGEFSKTSHVSKEQYLTTSFTAAEVSSNLHLATERINLMAHMLIFDMVFYLKL